MGNNQFALFYPPPSGPLLLHIETVQCCRNLCVHIILTFSFLILYYLIYRLRWGVTSLSQRNILFQAVNIIYLSAF